MTIFAAEKVSDCCINIRSLLPKLDELKVYVQTACPDILVISESWFKKSLPSTAVSLPGYSVFRQDRSTKGGGVAIYCKDSLQCSVILSRSVPKQLELVLLRISLSKNNSITVAGCYRPPSAPACALGALSELIAPYTSSEFVLVGDLNWDMLNLPTTVQLQLDALNLSQIIDAPNRFNNMHPEKENGTLLDVILTNRPTRYTSSVFCQSMSDHCSIACIRGGVYVKSPPLIIYKRHLKNFNAFLHDLADEQWHRINPIPTLENA